MRILQKIDNSFVIIDGRNVVIIGKLISFQISDIELDKVSQVSLDMTTSNIPVEVCKTIYDTINSVFQKHSPVVLLPTPETPNEASK